MYLCVEQVRGYPENIETYGLVRLGQTWNYVKRTQNKVLLVTAQFFSTYTTYFPTK